MSANIESQVRPEIRSMLSRLRGRIRQYVLVDAFARIIAVLGILFWLSFGMNWAYFKLSNLELPIWFRVTFMFLSVTGSILFACWLMLPMLRMMRAKALALVLERRFPELDDRLITSVEVAESRGDHETELTAHMLKKTIDDVSRTVDGLHIGDVFDKRPRQRALTVALTLAVSVGALAVVNFDAMKTWAAAYINYEDIYWDRQTTIVIKVIAQPNDREKDFLDEEGRPTNGRPGTYKHPRDEELALVVEIPSRAEPVEKLATRQHALIEQMKKAQAQVDDASRKAAFTKLEAAQSQLLTEAKSLSPESNLGRQQMQALQRALKIIPKAMKDGDKAINNKTIDEQAAKAIATAAMALDERAAYLHANDWKVPETIELDYRLADGRGNTSVTLHRKGDGERQFLHSIGGLTDTIDALYIKGGDFANRRPYRVVVVEPPRLDSIVLESNYPAYTGRGDYDEKDRPIRDHRGLKGTQTALPMETEFLLHAFGNKQLVGVRLQADVNEQDVREIEVQVKPFREEAAGSMQVIVTATDGSRRIVDLPAETAWRFRLIPAEISLAERFAEIVQTVEEIRETPDADGKIHRLDHNTAAEAMDRLRNLAKESGEIENSYRKLLKQMDRNPVYPRLLTERMQESIVTPLAGVNRQLFPATERLLKALASTEQGDTGRLDRTVSARKGVEVMLLAMNNVLNEMSDGTRFDVPFHISSHALTRLANKDEELTSPLPLPPDREIRIYLEDTDDIIGTSPTRLTINGTIDKPPVVETRLRGISTAITRLASIPVAGFIRDDYGIIKARFEFLVDANQPTAEAEAKEDAPPAVEGEEGDKPADEAVVVKEKPKWRIRQFAGDFRPQDGPLEFTLENSLEDRYPAARFELLPLDLQVGQELTLTVYAADGDDINGPHFTRGEKYRFRIVSNEELLSLLYGRELGVRRRFEQIIEEVEETKKDLELHRGRLDEADKLDAGEDRAQLEEIDDAVGNAAGRSFHQVSKNHSETRDVAQSFRELLEEYTNNGVHTDDQERRIEALIVAPLDEITKNDFPAVLTTVNLFKQAHEKGADSRSQIGDSIEVIDTLLLHMKKVLGEMKDLMEFHEAIRDLETIINEQGDLEREAKEKQKKEAIEKLKKFGLD